MFSLKKLEDNGIYDLGEPFDDFGMDGIKDSLEIEFSLRRLADSLDPPEDSTYSPPQILRVKVQTTDALLELTCSMKHSLKDSQLPSSKSTQPSITK